jgi:hypothetical protein
MFLPTPVPREVVDEALALAQHAPSSRVPPRLKPGNERLNGAPAVVEEEI